MLLNSLSVDCNVADVGSDDLILLMVECVVAGLGSCDPCILNVG